MKFFLSIMFSDTYMYVYVCVRVQRAARGGREKRRAASSRSAEIRRVHQLERQIRDLNDIIKKRFPNSLSALIMATNSAERGENPTGMTFKNSGNSIPILVYDVCAWNMYWSYHTGGGVASITLAPPTSAAHLEQRVKELEGEVKRRAEEERKRLRALQQKYSAMEVCVSANVFIQTLHSHTHTHTHTHAHTHTHSHTHTHTHSHTHTHAIATL